MARFECFSRTQRPDMDLLPIATEALQSQGFKVRSAIGESISLVDSQPVKRFAIEPWCCSINTPTPMGSGNCSV